MSDYKELNELLDITRTPKNDYLSYNEIFDLIVIFKYFGIYITKKFIVRRISL